MTQVKIITITRSNITTTLTIKINKSSEDGEFTLHGFVRIHLAITAGRDISIYPTQGTVVLDNIEQHTDAVENWDGDIASGATKDGWITFPVKSLVNVSDIKNVRLKFDSYYETDDDYDDNSEHEYDFILTLGQ